jgi:hypothetical protein
MGIPQGLAPITYGRFTQSTPTEVAMSDEQRIRNAEGALFDRYNFTVDESFVALFSPKIRLRGAVAAIPGRSRKAFSNGSEQSGQRVFSRIP